MLQSGEGWPKACGVPCSIKLVSITFCECSTWILHFCDAWLLGIVMSVQVSRFTAKFCKNTERFNLKAISILKMSGIDGSFILYNNAQCWLVKGKFYRIEGFMWRHIMPILQVIILATAMLVSSLQRAVLENTIKFPITFYLGHTTIPNYNWVTRILAHTISGNFNSFYELKVQAFFCCFSLYWAKQKGNQAAGQSHARMGAYRVVQTLYTGQCNLPQQL